MAGWLSVEAIALLYAQVPNGHNVGRTVEQQSLCVLSRRANLYRDRFRDDALAIRRV